MAVNGRALTAIGTGVLFVWSGIKGWSVLGSLGDLLTGRKPNQPELYPLSVAGSGAGTGSGNASGLAGIALQYQGHAYVFGGAPGKDGSHGWDCSSFVNFVVGVKAGKAIPGYGPGRYDGSTHGPTTVQWAAWTGFSSVKRSDIQAGDIIVWADHMGIATDANNYISAHSPAKGTTVTNIPTSGLGPIIRIGRM